jgi:hypothetical protein
VLAPGVNRLLTDLFFLAATATVVRSASRKMATICSSRNRLFLIGSSLWSKSHLPRNQVIEKVGQVKGMHGPLAVWRNQTAPDVCLLCRNALGPVRTRPPWHTLAGTGFRIDAMGEKAERGRGTRARSTTDVAWPSQRLAAKIGHSSAE